MHRVLVTRALPDGVLADTDGWEVIGPPAGDAPLSPDELRQAAGGVDAIVCLLTDRIDRGVLAASGGRLRIVANVAVGYDNIDVAAAHEFGIAVTNTPGVLDETTADLAFLLLLAAARLATSAEADLRAGRWAGWGITQYLGRDVHGATLGLVGWGRIAQAVARRATGFGMTVLHHSRSATGEPGYRADLDELLAQSDAVSLHVPLTGQTRHLIDARRLAVMKRTAVLVNTSRGPIVDEAALAESLHSGQLFAAGLDVFEAEPAVHPHLLTAPRTVLLPHIGSASVQTRTAMGRSAVASVRDVLAGRTPTALVVPSSTGGTKP